MDNSISNLPTTPAVVKDKWYREWRTIAAYTYLIICLHDFMLAPIFGQIWSVYSKMPYVVWEPLTLHGGALFHIAFMTIIGISAYGKATENTEAIKNMPDFSGITK